MHDIEFIIRTFACFFEDNDSSGRYAFSTVQLNPTFFIKVRKCR